MNFFPRSRVLSTFLLIFWMTLFSAGVLAEQYLKPPPCEIQKADLQVARDLGHGGSSMRYSIEKDLKNHTYRLTWTKTRLIPVPGGENFKPSSESIAIKKSDAEVKKFLRELYDRFKVFKILQPGVFLGLHPTFYKFNFKDSCFNSHGFSFVPPGSSDVLSKPQAELVTAFESFFKQDGR